MAATLGGERMKERTYVTDDRHRESWRGQQATRLSFNGIYRFELAVEDSARMDCSVTGWQDSTRVIIIVEGISEPIQITYLADLKEDVALYARSEGGERTAMVGRVSSFLRPVPPHSRTARDVEKADSLINTHSTVLGRTCQQWTRLRQGSLIMPARNRLQYWVDPSLPSPFAEIGGWLPWGTVFSPLHLFTELRNGAPLKVQQGRALMRMTRIEPRPVPPIAVDLRDHAVVPWDFQAYEPSDADPGIPVEPVPEPPVQEDWYTFTDPMPQFPGGEEAFKTYLKENLRYPELEREMGIQGTVYLSIIVETNGVVTNITPLREVSGGRGLTKEAIRVLKAMPPWTPGRMNGKPVRVKMNVPVKFRLE